MNVKLTVREITENEAVLKFEDGQVLSWPLGRLPKNSKPGDVLMFKIYDDGSEKEPEQLAKDLLNEILNTD
jgi:hypothetical protein